MPDRDPVDITLDSYESGWTDYLGASRPPAERAHDMTEFLDRFAALVGAGQVLELGSGPGWDADHLTQRGVQVERTDASRAFVDHLRSTGNEARVLDARADDFGGPYDGLMANAVLLHLDRDQLARALLVARRAVRKAGILAMTLKEGDGAAWSSAKLDRPRHFTYWRAPQVTDLLDAAGWELLDMRHVQGRTEPWLFVFARAA